MSEGISIRLKEKWDAHPDSHVTVLCHCGQSFSKFGPTQQVSDEARAFLYGGHDCPFPANITDATISQRTGDETL